MAWDPTRSPAMTPCAAAPPSPYLPLSSLQKLKRLGFENSSP